MRFYAYNPLAGGILTGKLQYDSEPTSGRFSSKSPLGQRYRERFWYKPIFDAQDKLKPIAEAQGTTNTAFALHWLIHHSQLIEGDGIIIGGSSIQHIKENLEVIAKSAPLSTEVLEVIDECWDSVKGDCPNYFR